MYILNFDEKKVPIDGARPANMSGDLPDKKSQLDLRSFGVRVPAMGRTIMP